MQTGVGDTHDDHIKGLIGERARIGGDILDVLAVIARSF